MIETFRSFNRDMPQSSAVDDIAALHTRRAIVEFAGQDRRRYRHVALEAEAVRIEACIDDAVLDGRQRLPRALRRSGYGRL